MPEPWMVFSIRQRRRFLLLAFFFLVMPRPAVAHETQFPVPPGLEAAVEFWKEVFTRFSSNDVVFFDPVDPGKIYNVLRVPDDESGRALIDKEQARIIADYELNQGDGRVRSQRGAKEQFLSGLKVSGRYLKEMQRIFREQGLPPELAYLPLVESSFNVRARSGAGAVGMWQFMAETGRKFLRISDAVDERRDPTASTRAAARLLKENYRLLGTWPLAVTAYNHGTDGIFRAIETVGSRSLVDLIRGYESPTFGFASKNFYAEFLAALDVAANSEAHFPFLRIHRPWSLREVEVKRLLPVHSLLKPTAISENDFFDWNPALSSTIKYVPSGYRVKLPPEKVASFLAAERRLNGTPSAKKAAGTVKANAVSSRGRKGMSLKTTGKAQRKSVATVRQAKGAKRPAKRPVALAAATAR